MMMQMLMRPNSLGEGWTLFNSPSDKENMSQQSLILRRKSAMKPKTAIQTSECTVHSPQVNFNSPQPPPGPPPSKKPKQTASSESQEGKDGAPPAKTWQPLHEKDLNGSALEEQQREDPTLAIFSARCFRLQLQTG